MIISLEDTITVHELFSTVFVTHRKKLNEAYAAKMHLLRSLSVSYTLFQKKHNISEVALLLEKSVPGKIHEEKLRFFWKRVYQKTDWQAGQCQAFF